MIEIVKPNNKKCLIICPDCKCEFTGIVEDLTKHNACYYIQCPQCKKQIEVSFYVDGSFDKYWTVYYKKQEIEKQKEEDELRKKQKEKELRKSLVSPWRRFLGLY